MGGVYQNVFSPSVPQYGAPLAPPSYSPYAAPAAPIAPQNTAMLLAALLLVMGQMQGGWQGFVGAAPVINVMNLAPPMPGAYNVVGVNTAPYALLPAGQGSLR